MVKILPKKRLAERAAQASLLEPGPKRVKQEEVGNGLKINDLSSVPRYENAERSDIRFPLPPRLSPPLPPIATSSSVAGFLSRPVAARVATRVAGPAAAPPVAPPIAPPARPLAKRKPTPRESLKKIYPTAMYKEVMRPKRVPRVTTNNTSGIPAVYVVNFARSTPGPWSEHEVGVVGTYHSAEAANLQVMAFFHAEAPWLTLGMVKDYAGRKAIAKRPAHDADGSEGVSYWIDKDNCLQLVGEDKEDGRYTVYACRQEVKKDPFSGPYEELPQRLTSEEWELQDHVKDGFRHWV